MQTDVTCLVAARSAGTGCFVKSVAWGAGRQPLILGKPNNPMFQVIQQR